MRPETEVTLRDWYPGLSPGEAAVWSRWLRGQLASVRRCSYAVSVGSGRPVPDGLPDWLSRDWVSLTRLRIDVVMEWGEGLWVVEVKERMSLSALGQCLVYSDLLAKELALAEAPRMMHVCSLTHPDLLDTFARCGVVVAEV